MRTIGRFGPRRRGIHAATAVAVLLAASALVAPATTSAAPARESATAPSCLPLHVGSRSRCVLTLQKRLLRLHYDLHRPGRTYDEQTLHAVVAFQKVNGMPRSGSMNAAVWRRLFHGPAQPHLRYIQAGRGIEVNLTKQVLLRAESGRLARIYDVSTGRPSLPTPVSGRKPFHIWRKRLWGPTGNKYSYGDREHFVNYYRKGTLLAIHEYSYVPPYPASHGCIRVPHGSAHRLWLTTRLRERVYTFK